MKKKANKKAVFGTALLIGFGTLVAAAVHELKVIKKLTEDPDDDPESDSTDSEQPSSQQ